MLRRSKSSFLLCYVGHHDDAYNWAQRRKLETHPTTGAAQLVEVRETVQEIVIPTYIAEEEDYYDHRMSLRVKRYLFRTVKGNYFVYIKSLNSYKEYKDIKTVSLWDAVDLYCGTFSHHLVSFESAFPGVNVEDA